VTTAYASPWEPVQSGMAASQSLPALHEESDKPDKPEYLAARAALRGAAGLTAGLTASFGELPR
jgi:hypothetical protein